MKQLLLLLLSLLSFNSFGQNCDELFAKKVDIEKESVELINEIIANIKKFENCGVSKEDIDIVNFENGFLHILLFKEISKGTVDVDNLTYGWFFQRLKTFVDSEIYKEMKPTLTRIKDLYEREIDIKSWVDDRKILEEIGLNKIVLDRIEEDLLFLQESGFTYSIVVKNYQSVYDEEVRKEGEVKIRKIIKNRGYVPFEDFLQEANTIAKPLVLFFTCYACANSLKMIDNVLLTDKVYQKLVSDFHFVSVYVDDMTMLPEEEWIHTEKRTLKTVGRINVQMQIDVLDAISQPYFAIFDKNGKVIKTQETTLSIEEFLDFLNLEN